MFRQPSHLQQLRHAILHVIRAITLPIDKVRNHNLKSQVNPFNYHTYRAALTPMPDRIPEWDIEPFLKLYRCDSNSYSFIWMI